MGVVGAALLVLSMFSVGHAQRRRGYGAMGDPNDFYTPPGYVGNHPYDGRFTFARIKYRGFDHFAQEGPGWAHDYPRADSHLMLIMREVTALRPFVREGPIIGGNIVALDDPQLFKYPVAYMSEPGGWHPNLEELKGFREYLMKGGFIVFDDFGDDFRAPGGSDLLNAQQEIQRVMPAVKILPLPKTHPIFDAFFTIDPEKIPWTRTVAYRGRPQFFAIFEDNDPRKRVMAVLGNNLDIGEAWEFSDEGFEPVSESNEAYKLGVNFLIYALTH
jgi:hypothetical protein